MLADLCGQHLDGDRRSSLVSRRKDLAHTTRANRREDFIVAKVCPLVDVQFFQMFNNQIRCFPRSNPEHRRSATNSAIFTRLSAATISAAFSPIMIDAGSCFRSPHSACDACICNA